MAGLPDHPAYGEGLAEVKRAGGSTRSAAAPWHSGAWPGAAYVLQSEQDLTGLTPERGLVAAETIEGESWQIGQPEITTGALHQTGRRFAIQARQRSEHQPD
jgi:hypothetical protein